MQEMSQLLCFLRCVGFIIIFWSKHSDIGKSEEPFLKNNIINRQ